MSKYNDEHFKADYKDQLRDGLLKLRDSMYNVSRLSRKQSCAILWSISNQFHRDTDKKFDPKAALATNIANDEYFKLNVDGVIDSLADSEKER